MKLSTRRSALAFSIAALFGLAAMRTTEAGQWSLSGLLDPQAPASAPIDNSPVQLALNGHHYRDGSYTGAVTDAYYGQMQVKANIQGGRITSVDVLRYPADRSTSRRINSRALPMLQSEVIQAQSTNVNIVSGATLSSKAYLRSLTSALAQAGA